MKKFAWIFITEDKVTGNIEVEKDIREYKHFQDIPPIIMNWGYERLGSFLYVKEDETKKVRIIIEKA